MSEQLGPEVFEREGLLDGVHGSEREARLDQLQQLADDGASLEELRRAVARDRLAMLPIERVFTSDLAYTLAEFSEQTGLDTDFIARDYLALGVSRPVADEPQFSEADVAAGKMLKQFMDAGVSEEDVLELARIVGRSSAAFVDAVLEVLAKRFLRAGDTQRDAGLRFAGVASTMMPFLGPLLENPARLHLREIVRREVIGRAEVTSGRLPDTREVTVGFADLVGWTRLGEAAPVEAVGRVAARMATAAAEVAEPPVRLIKLIGDAAMFVSSETDPLLEATLRLIERAAEDDQLPALRAGVARGPALGRAGDWYGRPVNLASRITGVAEPDGLLATREVHDSATGDFEFGGAKQVSLKGIDEPVAVYRVERG
jgi:adenylate cyclase